MDSSDVREKYGFAQLPTWPRKLQWQHDGLGEQRTLVAGCDNVPVNECRIPFRSSEHEEFIERVFVALQFGNQCASASGSISSSELIVANLERNGVQA